MTVVNPKSISGINSITTGSGSDDILTIHNNNGTERLRVDSTGATKIVTGIVTTLTATSSAKVGSGVTLSSDGDIFATGVCTATSFSGDGSSLTGIAATDNVRTGILDVAGVGTFRGDVNIPDKIIHLGDTDTAIRFPSANTITAETGGSERARIDSNGKVVIGHNASVAGDGSSEFSFQILGTTYVTSGLNQQRYANDVSGPSIILGKSRATSIGTHTIVQNGDQLGKIRFYGSDGNDFNNYGAEIAGHVDGSPGSDDMPGRLVFKTTADGSASSTERLRIGSEGNLALGGTNTSAYATQAHFFIGGVGDIYADTGTGSGKSLSITNNAYINAAGNWVYRATDKASNIYQYDGIIGFRYVASGTAGNTITWTEAARFDHDGRLLIGTTTYPDGSADGIALKASNGERAFSRGSTATRYQLVFYNPNGNIGRIETSGSSTSYLTSSDYRLKENATAISDGITRLKTLKPYRFNFKADATKTLDGFFAHEVTAVPEAVSGTKDEVDSDNKPVYQAIDQAKLVPLLTAALQEAVAKIEVLETRLNNAGIAT